MYWCESWTIRKSEHWRIDVFKLWCWRRLLRVPWTKEIKPGNHKGNQPWIFSGRTDAEAEAPLLWPPDVKSQLIGKDPDGWERLRAGREGGDRGWDGWIASPSQWTWVWVNSGSWWRTGGPAVWQFVGSQRGRQGWATELNWTDTFWVHHLCTFRESKPLQISGILEVKSWPLWAKVIPLCQFKWYKGKFKYRYKYLEYSFFP